MAENEVEDLKALENRVREVEKAMERINVLVERSINVLEKFESTMNTIQLAMRDISNKLQNNETSIVDLKKGMDKISKTIEVLEEKTKFDIMKWIKDNFIAIGLLGGAIMYFISKYLKI